MQNILFITDIEAHGSKAKNFATREVITSLARNDQVQLYLICPKIPERILEELGVRKNNCLWVSFGGSKNLILNLVLCLQSYGRFLRLKNVVKIDLLMTRFSFLSFIAPCISRIHDIPLVVLMRGYVPEENMRSLFVKHYLRGLARLLVKQSVKTYLAYGEIREWLRRIGAGDNIKLEVFYNAADPAKFRQMDRREAQEKAGIIFEGQEIRIVLGFVGTLKRYHAVDLLIHAIKILKDRMEVIECLVIGDGPLKEELMRLAQQLGVSDCVRFLGLVPHEEVPYYICSCDLLYGYIRKDFGSPIKCYEYLCCERLIIARRCKEFEFVENLGFGYLLEDPSANDVATSIERFRRLSMHERRTLERGAREHIMKNHTWDILADKIQSVAKEESRKQ